MTYLRTEPCEHDSPAYMTCPVCDYPENPTPVEVISFALATEDGDEVRGKHEDAANVAIEALETANYVLVKLTTAQLDFLFNAADAERQNAGSKAERMGPPERCSDQGREVIEFYRTEEATWAALAQPLQAARAQRTDPAKDHSGIS